MTTRSLGRPVEILLVEDNPGDVRLTQEAAKGLGIPNNITVAEDGEEAIAYLRKQGKYANAAHPDMVLLDLNLPKKSGQEVLAEIKTDPDLKRIPVIVLTVSQAEQDIMRSYELQANNYVTKPMNLDEFTSTVRGVINYWLAISRIPKK